MSMSSASSEYFKNIAEDWNSISAGYFSTDLRDAAMTKAYLRAEDTVADVGGGTGFLSAELAGRVARVHLIDGSAEMIAVARKSLVAFDNIEYHQAESAALPLDDALVDAALANMYLHHCPNPLAAIREMARILKPGGRLVITDMEAHDHAWMKAEMKDEWLGFSREEIRGWLHAAGLVNIIVSGSGQKCCADQRSAAAGIEADKARIGVFIAVGTRMVEGIHTAVQADYSQHALGASSCCGDVGGNSSSCCSTSETNATVCCGDESGLEVVFDLGYTPTELATAPAEAAEIALGCGNPLAMAGLKAGETVVDIGSGGGIDAFLAARKVGPEGVVIGVDMTPAMLRRARQTALANGYRNVQFRQGQAEALPVADGKADVVISNCVINLTADKGQVFVEAYRVLKPGGRLEVSDMVTDGPLPGRMNKDAANWAGCVSGALPEQEYIDLIREAGFDGVVIRRSGSAGVVGATNIYSVQVSAVKPVSPRCCEG